MSLRILRIELRRSMARVVGPLFVVAALLLGYLLTPLLFRGSGAWDLQWNGLVIQPRHLLTFIWAFIVGFGALQGMRDKRSKVGELFDSTPRPQWQRAGQLAGAFSLSLLGGYLAFLLVGAIQVATNATYFPLGVLLIGLVGAAIIVAGGLLGLGIGRLLPSFLTPPAAAMLGMVALAFVETERESGFALLSPSLARIHDVQAFHTLLPSVSVAQLVWFTAIAATGLLLFVARRRWIRAIAVVPPLVGVLIAVPLLPGDPGKALAVDRGAVELVCADGQPRVCVTRVHEAKLAELVEPAREALALLGKLPDAPTAVMESTAQAEDGVQEFVPEASGPVESRPADFVPISYDSLIPAISLNDAAGPVDERFSLLLGAGTPACRPHDEDRERELGARQAVASWLDGELRLKDASDVDYAAAVQEIESANSWAKRAWAALRELPADVQLERVAAYRSASLTCSGDLYSVLVDGAR
ncbi:hypothetical protein EV191_103145 [Tamaricihabitans halophyticus]|uniref:ABC-type transport system involved in multi-copper enzyme maturation permease subunit n=1 Tax=Tamaricihabitans halophyticus TaxID=1262583 RepID=A0A4R2QXN0_9PSEU|nr:hypothetical protein [Tamaricihabitans halophyticus]TCP54104.1 hypothetical protein EV191_103145 [Tamaricihabitans halophyticus]